MREREQPLIELRRSVPAAGPGNTAVAVAALLVAAAGGAGFGVGWLLGASTAVLGTLLAVAAAALAVGTRRLVAGRYAQVEVAEERVLPEDSDEPLTAVPPVHRRGLLSGLLAAAAGLFGLSLLAPITSLGQPRRGITQATPWQEGLRLIDEDGEPVRADAVPPGGVAIAWPEGVGRAELASVIIVRLEDRRPESPTRLEWVVQETIIAYSKICTHAGCPVGLYQAPSAELYCPCHQATFDAARGATPTFGPAVRNLPQLPLGVDDDGYLVALGDFVDPVGPTVG